MVDQRKSMRESGDKQRILITRTTIFLLADRVSDLFASNPPVVDNLKVETISLLNSRSAFNFCRISNFLRRSNSLKRLRCTRYYTHEKVFVRTNNRD